MSARAFVGVSLRMFSGVIVWAAHFAAIYAFTALACARHFAGAVPWVIGVVTFVALAVLVATALPAARDRADGFETWLALAISGLALFAIVIQAVPALIVPVCG